MALEWLKMRFKWLQGVYTVNNQPLSCNYFHKILFLLIKNKRNKRKHGILPVQTQRLGIDKKLYQICKNARYKGLYEAR